MNEQNPVNEHDPMHQAAADEATQRVCPGVRAELLREVAERGLSSALDILGRLQTALSALDYSEVPDYQPDAIAEFFVMLRAVARGANQKMTAA